MLRNSLDARGRSRYTACVMLYKDDETLPASPSPSHPARLGEFRLERELGRGGMGIVYLAEQERLGRKVALKVLALAAAPTAVAAERFLREASLVARLEHENIVRVYAMGQEQGCLFYAMELVEGESLRDRIARGTFPPREVAEMGRAVARALECAHGAGIIHRDVKPANILLDGAGVPHLADFGLAHGEDSKSLTISGDLLGTPAYMSPEQASAHDDVDARADVYALGAVLYEALSGNPPCGLHKDIFAQLQAVRLIDPVSPARLNARIPRDLDVIVMRCLEKDRTRRYATAAALAEDLDRFLRGEAILARPPSVSWRMWRFVRRHWAAAGAFAVLLVAGASGAAFWATRPGYLSLRVQPPDAVVRIDGGTSLPAREVERLQLAVGAHAIRVERGGYLPLDLPYVVARAESAIVPVNLERLAERVRIVTDPPDCPVLFHGGEGSTFRRLSTVDEEIAVDRYDVVFDKEGHRRERLRIDVQEGRPVDLRVTLPPAVLWAARMTQPSTPLVAPMTPGGPPVIAACSQGGEVAFFRAADGEVIGRAQATGELCEPLAIDIGHDGVPELLLQDPAGGVRLVRWGTGEHLWTQHAPPGRVEPFPMIFRAADGGEAECRIGHPAASEVLDLRSGAFGEVIAPFEAGYGVVLSDDPPRFAFQRESCLFLYEGRSSEVARLDTPAARWGPFVISSFDLDRDGRREVGVRYADGSIHVYGTDRLERRWQTAPSQARGAPLAVGALRSGEDACLVTVMAEDRAEIYEADGRLRRAISLPAPPIVLIVLADMGADGVRDLAYPSAGAFHVVDLGSGLATMEVPLSRPSSERFAIADCDGDGLLDAIVSLRDGTLQVIPGRKTLWSHATGHSVRRSPTLLDLTGDGAPEVVFCSLDGNAYALEGGTGRLLWRAPTGGQAATTPAPVGEDFVLAAWGGRAQRVEGRTGRELWSYAPSVEGWSVNFHASPLVADLDGDRLPEVILADWRTDSLGEKEPSGAVHCLDAATGAVEWVRELASPFASAPAFLGAGELVVGDTDGNLVCLGPDGAEKWRETLRGSFRADPCRTPDGGVTWVVVETGEVVETRAGQGGSKPRAGFPRTSYVEWGSAGGKPIHIAAARKELAAFDPVTGKELWRHEAGGIVTARPLAIDLEADGDTEVFVADQGGRVSCLEAATGEVRWSWKAGASIEAWPLAADMNGDGRVELIVATSDGRVVVLNTRGHRWSGEWLTPWGDRFRTAAPDSVGPR